jgi:hypothetical protein
MQQPNNVQPNTWREALRWTCAVQAVDDPEVEAAADLIGEALDLGLITLDDAAAVKRMDSAAQLEAWLVALSADVALAEGAL